MLGDGCGQHETTESNTFRFNVFYHLKRRQKFVELSLGEYEKSSPNKPVE